jgi:hypothetical protein
MFNTALSFSFALVVVGGCAVTDSDTEGSQSAELGAKPAVSAFVLTVSGENGVEVTSSTSNATCNGTCNYAFIGGTPVTITALDDITGCTIFKHWDGACAGQGEVCSIVINSDLTTDAVFHFHPGTCQ